MGHKKKEKYLSYSNYSGGKKSHKGEFDKKHIEGFADALEAYYEVITEDVIISGPKKEIKEAEKGLRKMIKKLRSGNDDEIAEVIDKKAYNEYVDALS